MLFGKCFQYLLSQYLGFPRVSSFIMQSPPLSHKPTISLIFRFWLRKAHRGKESLANPRGRNVEFVLEDAIASISDARRSLQ